MIGVAIDGRTHGVAPMCQNGMVGVGTSGKRASLAGIEEAKRAAFACRVGTPAEDQGERLFRVNANEIGALARRLGIAGVAAEEFLRGQRDEPAPPFEGLLEVAALEGEIAE